MTRKLFETWSATKRKKWFSPPSMRHVLFGKLNNFSSFIRADIRRRGWTSKHDSLLFFRVVPYPTYIDHTLRPFGLQTTTGSCVHFRNQAVNSIGTDWGGFHTSFAVVVFRVWREKNKCHPMMTVGCVIALRGKPQENRTLNNKQD